MCAYLQACLALFLDTFGTADIGKLLQIINKKGGIKRGYSVDCPKLDNFIMKVKRKKPALTPSTNLPMGDLIV